MLHGAMQHVPEQTVSCASSTRIRELQKMLLHCYLILLSIHNRPSKHTQATMVCRASPGSLQTQLGCTVTHCRKRCMLNRRQDKVIAFEWVRWRAGEEEGAEAPSHRGQRGHDGKRPADRVKAVGMQGTARLPAGSVTAGAKHNGCLRRETCFSRVIKPAW